MFRSNQVGPYNDFPLLLSPQTVSLRVFSLSLSLTLEVSQTWELLSLNVLSPRLGSFSLRVFSLPRKCFRVDLRSQVLWRRSQF